LGSGNHFLEVQYIDEVYDEETARAYGIEEGLVTVLIHSGSRGLGHQVCQDYVERCMDAAKRYGIELEDRQLAAPIRSPKEKRILGPWPRRTSPSPTASSSPTPPGRPSRRRDSTRSIST
jgi:tRNA-splicing ligase RtcB